MAFTNQKIVLDKQLVSTYNTSMLNKNSAQTLMRSYFDEKYGNELNKLITERASMGCTSLVFDVPKTQMVFPQRSGFVEWIQFLGYDVEVRVDPKVHKFLISWRDKPVDITE